MWLSSVREVFSSLLKVLTCWKKIEDSVSQTILPPPKIFSFIISGHHRLIKPPKKLKTLLQNLKETLTKVLYLKCTPPVSQTDKIHISIIFLSKDLFNGSHHSHKLKHKTTLNFQNSWYADMLKVLFGLEFSRRFRKMSCADFSRYISLMLPIEFLFLSV